jgi:hypothetical protein
LQGKGPAVRLTGALGGNDSQRNADALAARLGGALNGEPGSVSVGDS